MSALPLKPLPMSMSSCSRPWTRLFQPSQKQRQTLSKGLRRNHRVCQLLQPAGRECALRFDSHDMPIGLQIVGKPGDERTVLNVAHQYELAAKVGLKHPIA